MNNSHSSLHIGLQVADIEKTISFYSKLFGISPVKVKADYAKFELREPALVISFSEVALPVNSSFGHFGFRVENDEVLNSIKSEIEVRGLANREEKDTVCCYARQDKFWISDPDGYEWEVYVLKEDMERAASASACC